MRQAVFCVRHAVRPKKEFLQMRQAVFCVRHAVRRKKEFLQMRRAVFCVRHAVRPKKQFLELRRTAFSVRYAVRPKKQLFINETGHVLCTAPLQETVPVMSGGIYTYIYEKTARIQGRI